MVPYHCSATGDWEKTNTCIGIGFRNRVSSFVGCNGSKLKDLYEKSFVSLPLIAIVSPFLFFLISAGSSVAAWRCAAPKEAETKKMHLAKVHLQE